MFIWEILLNGVFVGGSAGWGVLLVGTWWVPG
jgi:hypothetical protein